MRGVKLLPDSWRWYQVLTAGAILYLGMQIGGVAADLVGPMIEGVVRIAAGAAASAHEAGVRESL